MAGWISFSFVERSKVGSRCFAGGGLLGIHILDEPFWVDFEWEMGLSIQLLRTFRRIVNLSGCGYGWFVGIRADSALHALLMVVGL